MLFAGALLAGFITACDADNSSTNRASMKLQLTSTAFADGQPIPRRHTSDDQNLSPALQWSGAPPAAQSLALICDDPDAPMGVWVHWVVYDLPPATAGLAEGVPNSPELANGVKQGLNGSRRAGYDGPAPPPGKPHRYFFKLYALDLKPDLKPGLTKDDLIKAMDGHILAEGQLVGTYQRKN
jgi:hypothetical protein